MTPFFFTSPLWLAGMVPWALVGVYLLWGRRRRHDVPFLELWRGSAAVERVRWKISTPPLALVLAILSIAAAIIGAARPCSVAAPTAAHPISIILDRGLTMSAKNSTGEFRFQASAKAVAAELGRLFASATPISVWTIPTSGPAGPERFANAGDWLDRVSNLTPTALDSTEATPAMVRRLLATGEGAVIVISDAPLGAADRRVIQVAPDHDLQDIAITRLAARSTPHPALMVRVLNHTSSTRARLTVTFGDDASPPIRREIELPQGDHQRDFFFEPERIGNVISANIEPEGQLPAEQVAWVVRESDGPAIDLTFPSPALARLARIYSDLHPAGGSSRRVRVVSSETPAVLPEESQVIVTPATSPRWVHATRVVPHPITDAVRDWPALDLPAGDARPLGDWDVLVWAGEQPLLAARQVGAARQIWTCIDPSGWDNRAEFVAFWAAALDWAGGADLHGDSYVTHALESYTPGWRLISPAPAGVAAGTWPGLYRNSSGALRAFHADRSEHKQVGSPFEKELRTLLLRVSSHSSANRSGDLGSVAFLVAALLLLGAAVTWRPYLNQVASSP